MTIEILGFAGCPNFAAAVRLVRAAVREIGVDAEISEVYIDNNIAANEAAFLGSPTVRVNGLDVEIAARFSSQFGFSCRTYLVSGIRQGLPPRDWIETSIRQAFQMSTR